MPEGSSSAYNYIFSKTILKYMIFSYKLVISIALFYEGDFIQMILLPSELSSKM